MNEFELFKQREADYASRFEKLAKDFYTSLNRIKPSQSDAHADPYLAGYLETMDSAIESIKGFFDEDNLRKDYPKTFKEMREKYYQMYFGLKEDAQTDFNDGKYRAARDLYNGLDNVIQNAAEYDLEQLQKHQCERETERMMGSGF